jgi:hypothetical protein
VNGEVAVARTVTEPPGIKHRNESFSVVRRDVSLIVGQGIDVDAPSGKRNKRHAITVTLDEVLGSAVPLE